jgi:hypothetical protein
MKTRLIAQGCVVLLTASGAEILTADQPHIHQESPSEMQLFPSVKVDITGTLTTVSHSALHYFLSTSKKRD